MQINKEIIIQLAIGSLFAFIAGKVLFTLFWEKLKGKHLGLNQGGNDIDHLIKRKKELLQSQYNLSPRTHSSDSQEQPRSKEIDSIKKELSWGGKSIQQDIKKRILSTFSYQFSDSKISSFTNLVERKKYLQHLEINQSKIQVDEIINYLSTLFAFLVIVDEIKEKQLSFTESCAKKMDFQGIELALAIQIKILSSNKKIKFKEEKIFSDKLILGQLPDDILKDSLDQIISSEAVNWKKSISSLFEELSLYLKYASILNPISSPKNKEDLKGALQIFNLNTVDLNTIQIQELKKNYKKMAHLYHPDKIIPQHLPPFIEKRALEKYKAIKNSYDIIIQRNPNGSKT